ncbi:unnamed protein product [Diplocarpon coronariae]
MIKLLRFGHGRASKKAVKQFRLTEHANG